MIKVSIMQHGEIMRMLLGKSPVSKIVMLGNSIKKVPIKKKDAMRIRKRLRFVVCLSLSSFALSFLEKSLMIIRNIPKCIIFAIEKIIVK